MTITLNKREILLILRALNHQSLIYWENGSEQLSEECDRLYDRIYDGEGE